MAVNVNFSGTLRFTGDGGEHTDEQAGPMMSGWIGDAAAAVANNLDGIALIDFVTATDYGA